MLRNGYFFWELLRRICPQPVILQLFCGDFNEIVNNDEMHGTQHKPLYLMRNFQVTLEDYELMDLGFIEFPYTWERGRSSDSKLRLDNRGWWQMNLDRLFANSLVKLW